MAKAKMTYTHVKYSVFENACKKLNLAGPDLSAAIGYSRSAFNIWRKAGLIPAVAGLACEALLRRNRIAEDAPEPTTMFFLRVPDKHLLAFQAFTAALDGIIRTQVGFGPGEG